MKLISKQKNISTNFREAESFLRLSSGPEETQQGYWSRNKSFEAALPRGGRVEWGESLLVEPVGQDGLGLCSGEWKLLCVEGKTLHHRT